MPNVDIVIVTLLFTPIDIPANPESVPMPHPRERRALGSQTRRHRYASQIQHFDVLYSVQYYGSQVHFIPLRTQIFS